MNLENFSEGKQAYTKQGNVQSLFERKTLILQQAAIV